MQSEDHRRTALQYPLVHWTERRCQKYGAFSMEALARYQIILLGEQRTLGVNNLPRVVARIMPQSESNPRPLDRCSFVAFNLTESVSLCMLFWGLLT